MLNPENQRLSGDERAAAEAEAALARDEAKVAQKLDALLTDALDRRAAQLLARATSLETNPLAPAAEVAKAKAATGTSPADAVLAASERAAALAARRGALQARELALKALTAATATLETARAARSKELDATETVLATLEGGAKKAADERRKAEEAAKKDAERRELERRAAEAAKKAAEDATKTQPEMPAFALDKTQPGVPAAMFQPPPEKPAAKGAKAPAAAAAAKAAAPASKVSRRRRVRLAPPPKRLELEVASYGENNFYASFDNRITSGGVFVSSLETLPPGHELDVEIDIEGSDSVKARARVEWVRSDNFANPDCSQGAGLRLLSLTSKQAEAIESFFAVRPPIFYAAAQP